MTGAGFAFLMIVIVLWSMIISTASALEQPCERLFIDDEWEREQVRR